MNAQQQLDKYSPKMIEMVTRFARLHGLSAKQADKFARLMILGDPRYTSSDERFRDAEDIMRGMSGSFALDIVGKLGKAVAKYGEKAYAISEKQEAAVERFLNDLASTIARMERHVKRAAAGDEPVPHYHLSQQEAQQIGIELGIIDLGNADLGNANQASAGLPADLPPQVGRAG